MSAVQIPNLIPRRLEATDRLTRDLLETLNRMSAATRVRKGRLRADVRPSCGSRFSFATHRCRRPKVRHLQQRVQRQQSVEVGLSDQATSMALRLAFLT